MNDYLDGYGEGYYDDYFEDYSHDEMEEYCPDEYDADGYGENADPEPPEGMNEREQDDAGWISAHEASMLGYGFGYEEGRAERRRKKQLKKEARSRRLRRYRRS